MSRRRAGISPSLFPFLAVLICTLGTLILMLALVAQDAKKAASAAIEQEQQDKLAAAAKTKDTAVRLASSSGDASAQLSASAAGQMISQEQFRVNELVSYRDQQTADLEKKRDEIAQVEAHMRKIKEKLVALNTEVETAMTSTEKPATEIDTEEQTLLLVKAEAEKLRAEIKELESSERGSKPRVVIVPHRGPNGTQRRPVYVICDAEGLKVMPEGVRITKAQALAATETDSPLSNPLGSALGVARRFSMQQYGDKEPPYPLLIVRPDGIYMYRIASALMKDWDDQYGYELVPAEVDLAFPGGDQVLRKDMEIAIEEAAARNYSLAGGGGGGRGRGRGNGGGGGDGGENFEGNTAESMLAGNLAGGEGDGPGNVGKGSDGPGSEGGSVPGNSNGGGSATRPQRSLPTLSARDLDRQAQNKGYSLARDQRFTPGGYSEPPGSRTGGYGAAPTVQSNSDALNSFLSGQSPEGVDDAPEKNGAPQKNGGTGTNPIENSQRNASLAKNASDGGPGGEGADGQANISGGDSPTGTSATAAATMQQQKSAGQSGLPESTSTAQNASSSNAIAMALSDAGQSGSPQSGNSSGSPQTADASTSAPTTPQVAQKMVRPEGEDWALPDAFRGMGGTEFVRPISMRLQHDRYELVEQGRVVQTFPFGDDGIYRPTLQLATAIRDRVANWGATMRGGYWKPRLEVSVGPHAEQRFVEFEKLMQNSGVEVARRSP